MSMVVLNPIDITPTSTFTRSTVGSYFDKTGALQSAAINVPRYTWDPVTHSALGILLENEATNILLNSATVVTQSITVTAQRYVLSFWGTGTITLSGVASAVVVGTGTTRKIYAFTPTAGSLTLTVTGTVTRGQLEAKATDTSAQLPFGDATSYIVTAGSAVTRGADVLTGTFLTNVVEPVTTGSNPDPSGSYAAYDPVHAYALNELCYSATTHRRYRSRTAANTGNSPLTATISTPTTYWEDIGSTCAYAGLDLKQSSAACADDHVVYVLRSGQRIDMVALDDIRGAFCRVIVWRAGQVFSYTEVDMINRKTTRWYEYLTGRFRYKKSHAVIDIPPYTDSIICVVVDNLAAEAKLGDVGIGLAENIGDTQLEAEADAQNFSEIKRNFDGSLGSLIPRLNIPLTNQTVWSDHDKVDRIRELRDDLNGRCGFYIGLADQPDHSYYQTLFMRGIYRRWGINLKHEDHAVITLGLEKIT